MDFRPVPSHAGLQLDDVAKSALESVKTLPSPAEAGAYGVRSNLVAAGPDPDNWAMSAIRRVAPSAPRRAIR